MIQRRNNKRERARETATQERICGYRRRSVQCESVDEVVQRGLEDGEEACPHHHEADAGNDPVDARQSRPTHEELTP